MKNDLTSYGNFLPNHQNFQRQNLRKCSLTYRPVSNLEKHKVDFYDAILVFENETVETPDEKREYGKTRFNALGHVDDEFYMVTYTWRGERRRTISAWKVGRDGRRRYREKLAQRGAKEA